MSIIETLFRSASKLVYDPAPPLIDCPFSIETLKKNAETAVRNSEQARSTHHKFADMWCRTSKGKIDPDTSVVMGPTKTAERFIEKAVARYSGDVFQVSDGVRNRILIDSPTELKYLKDAIQTPKFADSCKAKGIVITGIEDFFEKPNQTRWRALVVKTEIDLGKGRTQKAETVVIPRDWVADLDTTHVYLEQVRVIKDLAKAQRRDLTEHEQEIVGKHSAEARAIHDYLAKTDGYDHLEIARPHVRLAASGLGVAGPP